MKTLRAGFTTVADLGASNEAIFALRDAVRRGDVPGPRIIAAGYAFEWRQQSAVDLPGYGFAQLAQTSQSVWDKELGSYLADRPSLVGTVLIVDCRRGLLELDYALIKWVGHRQLPVHILLSKADKFNRQEQVLALRATQKALDPYRVNGHEITVQLWSALKKIGMVELETQLSNWVRPPAASETPETEPEKS